MTPVDICLLLMSLEAIEHVSTQERSNTQSTKKASNKGRKGNKRCLVPSLQPESPRKLAPRRSIATSARSMGARVPHTTPQTTVGTRKLKQKNLIPVPQRKAEINPIPQTSLLHNLAENRTSLRRQSRSRMPNGRNVAVAIVIST
jgi:hypothetical protein